MESLEALLREVEIASMAKVWAHPDDLAAIIEGIRGQEQMNGARMVSGQVGSLCAEEMQPDPAAARCTGTAAGL